jgi:hypothetical protein
MLVSVNDVANQLKISNRAVQIKCKREGLVKIGNQYQITKEIADKWMLNSETKQRNESEHTHQISHPKRKEVRSFTSLIVFLCVAFVMVVLTLFYMNLNNQINVSNNTIIENNKEHKTEIKDLNKRLNDARDVIQNQELEIQSLKIKDSLRYIKRW